MPFENEIVAIGVKTVLETNLSAMLDTIEAEWAATDPVTLPDPVTWFRGMGPVVLELYGEDFPFIGVIAVLREPDEEAGSDQLGYQSQIVTVYVHAFVYADDVSECNSLAYRYADAVCRVLLEYGKAVEGWTLMDSEPYVDLTDIIRHPKTEHADMQEGQDVGWLQGASIRLRFND